MHGAEDTALVLEAARQSRDRVEYERTVLEHFERTIGYDVALFLHPQGTGPVTPGFDASVLANFLRRLPVFQRELAPLEEAALAAAGVAVETDVFTRPELERTRYYQEVLRPLGDQSGLVGYFVCRGRPIGAIVLGRSRPYRFRDADRRWLTAVLPALTVADLATRSPSPARSNSILERLTPREREVAGYLRKGLTNREIALACGTSYRTVRNQLSAVYAKLGASNRTEALALMVDPE